MRFYVGITDRDCGIVSGHLTISSAARSRLGVAVSLSLA